MRKRTLSTLLALCIALLLLPTVHAADSSETAGWREPIERDGEIIGEFVYEDSDEQIWDASGIFTMSLDDGTIELKPTNEVRYIDRVVLPDYALNLYEVLEEAADGDGYNDYLIDDEYFDLSGEDIYSNETGDFIRGNVRFSSTGVTTRYTAILVTSVETAAADETTHMYVYNCIRTVHAAFYRDHPEVFWNNGLYFIRYTRNGRSYYCYVLSQAPENSDAWEARHPLFQPGGGLNLREAIAKRDADVEKIISTIPDEADRFTQVYYLNKWLTENNQYNTVVSAGFANNLPESDIARPWNSGRCVSALAGLDGADGPECGGFANAFKVLCDALGIPCVHVRYDHGDVVQSDGTRGRAHSWNYVQMEDGKWYVVDATANCVGEKHSGRETVTWLLVGGKTVISGEEVLVKRPPENPGNISAGIFFPNGPELNDTAYSPLLKYSGMPYAAAAGDSVSLTPKLSYGTQGVYYTYTALTSLPEGLALNPDTGKITGTLTALSDPVSVTIKAVNPADPADFARGFLDFPAVGPAIHTVTFDANGGELTDGTAAETDETGKLPLLPSAPTRTGCTFTGWYTQAEDGTRVTVDTRFTEDSTIYAHWVSDDSPTSGDCGTKVRWSYSDGILTIEGTGSMNNYVRPGLDGELPPWYDRHEQIHTVEIGEGVTRTGSYAFCNCDSLSDVTIPDSVTIIGANVFRNCVGLESVTLPAGVTSIGLSAFYGCSSLESVDIPDSVNSIGNYAFYNCSSLESVIIPDGVTSIGDYTFRGCSSLRGVAVPSDVDSIGDYAFYSCYNLRSVTLPVSVTSIGHAAFYDCGSLRTVYYGGSWEQWGKISIDEYNTALTSAILHPDSTKPDKGTTTLYASLAGDGRVQYTVNAASPMSVCVVAALYDGGGKLLETEMRRLTIAGQDSSGTMSLKPDGSEYVAVFLLDQSDCAPLCEKISL